MLWSPSRNATMVAFCEGAKIGTNMETFRTYGSRPFGVAVLHGGPGAAGEMAPVARELSSVRGIVEPLQSAVSVDGQIRELSAHLRKNLAIPATLVGWSWGAWLALISAARHPSLVSKLILVGSGPFEEKYAARIMNTRLSRLHSGDREEVALLVSALEGQNTGEGDTLLARLGVLMTKADSFDAVPCANDLVEIRHEVYQRVWNEAAELRRSGGLLRLGRRVRCPVVAIHGDYDPHPWEGVEEPLARVLGDFRFILLPDCGHRPWCERRARERFYSILKDEIS